MLNNVFCLTIILMNFECIGNFLSLFVRLSNKGSQKDLGDVFSSNILVSMLFTSLLISYRVEFGVSHKLVIRSCVFVMRGLFVHELSCQINNMKQVRNQDFLLKSLITAVISSGLMILAGYFPDSLENKLAFSKAKLSSPDLIFAIFISAVSIYLIGMVVDIVPLITESTRGGTVSLFVSEVKTFICVLHYSHLHVWSFLESNQSLIYRDVFSIYEILVSLDTFFCHHGRIWPVLALNFRKKSYAHEVNFKSTVVFSSYLSKPLFEFCGA